MSQSLLNLCHSLIDGTLVVLPAEQGVELAQASEKGCVTLVPTRLHEHIIHAGIMQVAGRSQAGRRHVAGKSQAGDSQVVAGR